MTTMECYDATPTVIGALDALIIEFRCSMSDMGTTLSNITSKFQDDFAIKKIEFLNEEGEVVSASYSSYGDVQISMQTPNSSSEVKEVVIYVQMTKLKGIEDKVAELTEAVVGLKEKVDPIIDTENMTLDECKSYWQKEIGKQITSIIEQGIDVELSDGEQHFSLETHDQTNIDNTFLYALIFGLGSKLFNRPEFLSLTIPYHENGHICQPYSISDIMSIKMTKDLTITYYTTLANAFNMWIARCTTKEEVLAINLSSTLPTDLESNSKNILNSTSNILNAFKEILEILQSSAENGDSSSDEEQSNDTSTTEEADDSESIS